MSMTHFWQCSEDHMQFQGCTQDHSWGLTLWESYRILVDFLGCQPVVLYYSVPPPFLSKKLDLGLYILVLSIVFTLKMVLQTIWGKKRLDYGRLRKFVLTLLKLDERKCILIVFFHIIVKCLVPYQNFTDGISLSCISIGSLNPIFF